MYNVETLVNVINLLRKSETTLQEFPSNFKIERASMPNRTIHSERHYQILYSEFVRKYDRDFRVRSPFNVGCAKFKFEDGPSPSLTLLGFKTYEEILWDIYNWDKRVGREDELVKPPPNLNFSIEHEIL